MTAYSKHQFWSVCAACFLGCSVLVFSLDSGRAQSPKAPSSDGAIPNTNEVSELLLEPPKPTQNQISVAGDFLIGEGAVTLPLGYGIGKNPTFRSLPNVSVPDRSSDYFGASASYSFGQTWYLDISYAHGKSDGNVDLAQLLGNDAIINGKFTIRDDWYQGYFRYAFPRRKKLTAYLRAGVTYVQSELILNDTFTPSRPGQLFQQNDDVTDILGNIGFGVGYSIHRWNRAELSVRFEGEGFVGAREQQIDEQGANGRLVGSAKIDNWLYGGLGRSIARFEYEIGRTGLLRVFADGGIQARYTFVVYDDFTTAHGDTAKGRTEGELLWGPYVRVGLSYSF